MSISASHIASDKKTRSIEQLGALVGFNTTSSLSNLPLLDYVESYLAQFGIDSRRTYDETGSKANLFATIGPADRPGYILSGHTDVVPVKGQDWSSDPFTLTERDGRIFGRGACDMKAYLACILAAVPDMVAANLQIPLHLAFSYDEEVGCIGVRRLIADLVERKIEPLGCFVGEPTEMKVVIGHKVKRSLRVTVRGKAGHSSLAPHFVNAIEYAAEMIIRIRELGKRIEREGHKDDLYDVPFTTSHTGVISGGTQLNIVPEKCQFDFEFRALPEDDVDSYVEEIKAFARDELEPRMQAIAPECGISFEWISRFPGLSLPADSDLAQLTAHLAQCNTVSKVAYGTEAGLFHENGGIPSIVCGPGNIAQAHQPDEYIEKSQLAACDQFLQRLISHCS